MKNKNGFTLIELLLAISVGALIIALVLVAVSQVRVKANDSRLVSDMDQLRKIAGVIYAENNMSNYCGTTCLNTSDARVLELSNDIDARNGTGSGHGGPNLVPATNSFCISTMTIKNETMCYDATGKTFGTYFGSGSGACASMTVGSDPISYYCQ